MVTNLFIQILWIFPVYSFLGWCLEVVYNSVNTGEFVNRGFLNGAACPIYGLGASFMILSLTPAQDNLFVLYFGSVAIGSLLELIGGFLLKKLFRMSWWDYSNQPLNVGGYICLKFSLAWGVVGVILMRVIHPLILNVADLIPPVPLTIMLTVFYISFAVDVVVTVLAVLKLNRDLREIDRLSELIHKSSDKIAEGIGNTAIQTVDKIKELELTEKTREMAERVQSAVEDGREKIQARLEDFEKLNALLNDSGAIRSRLFKAFPRMKNVRNSGALYEMRLRIKSHAGKVRGDKKGE